jgi:hypothetical protein
MRLCLPHQMMFLDAVVDSLLWVPSEATAAMAK